MAAEDIIIDIPRALPDDPNTIPTGVVSYFDPSKGYGFIVNNQSQERLFVHVNSLAEPNSDLNIGDKVSYTAIYQFSRAALCSFCKIICFYKNG